MSAVLWLANLAGLIGLMLLSVAILVICLAHAPDDGDEPPAT